VPIPNRTPPGRRWREIWSHPDPILADAGASGERVVADLRVFVTAALLAIPVGEMIISADLEAISIGLVIGLGALLIALTTHLVTRGDHYRSWMGFATSVLDVTLVSVVLASFLVLGRPHAAVNNLIIFPVYFLALAATALRYDPRVCATATAAAIVEYAAIVAYAAARWDLNASSFAPFTHGTFSWSTEVARLLLILCAGGISLVIVLRSRRLRWLSASDPVTSLMNRGYFEERIAEEEIRTKRYQRALCIAMCDIDRFKQFNDTYGHANGDDALRVVADAIRHSLRRTDMVARYGGEEFVIAMPETTRQAGLAKCEEIRRNVERARVLLRGSRGVTGVTVSLGVAAWPDDGDEIQTVLERADDRLYAAKQSGRNRVVGEDDTESRLRRA
jgi:diguanylate cyclase (GGDEF)-like protein